MRCLLANKWNFIFTKWASHFSNCGNLVAPRVFSDKTGANAKFKSSFFFSESIFIFLFEEWEFPSHQGMRRPDWALHGSYKRVIHPLATLKMHLWSGPKLSWPVNKGCLCKASEKINVCCIFQHLWVTVVSWEEKRGAENECRRSAVSEASAYWRIYFLTKEQMFYSVSVFVEAPPHSKLSCALGHTSN